MKVLSVREPFASLIMNNIKTIETRSYNTNYRGTIYIHASLSKYKNESRANYLRDKFNILKEYPGYIICKCKLVDSIKIDEEFLDKIKDDEELLLCNNFEKGKYAWILKDIKPIGKIKAKGRLGIWNYYSIDDVFKIMSDIRYGYQAGDGKIYLDDFEKFDDNYILESPKDVLKSKVGVCWDQVELERYLLSSHDIRSYFIAYFGKNTYTHTFLVIKEDDIYYWLENAFYKYRGIHKYQVLDELLLDVKNKFIDSEVKEEFDKDKLVLKEYSKPKYHLSSKEYFEWVLK